MFGPAGIFLWIPESVGVSPRIRAGFPSRSCTVKMVQHVVMPLVGSYARDSRAGTLGNWLYIARTRGDPHSPRTIGSMPKPFPLVRES